MSTATLAEKNLSGLFTHMFFCDSDIGNRMVSRGYCGVIHTKSEKDQSIRTQSQSQMLSVNKALHFPTLAPANIDLRA